MKHPCNTLQHPATPCNTTNMMVKLAKSRTLLFSPSAPTNTWTGNSTLAPESTRRPCATYRTALSANCGTTKVSKETYSNQKRPIQIKIEPFKSKETTQRNLVCATPERHVALALFCRSLLHAHRSLLSVSFTCTKISLVGLCYMYIGLFCRSLLHIHRSPL